MSTRSRDRGRLARTVLMAVLMVVPLPGAESQEPLREAEVHGRVVLRDGSAKEGLPGIPVRLEGGRLAEPKLCTSDLLGRYRFAGLAAGSYTVTVASPAFAPVPREVRLTTGETRRLDLSVDPLFNDALAVTATRTLRATSEVASAVAVIDRTDIEQTPMSNLADMLGAQPGVLVASKNQGYDTRLVIRGAGLKARYGVRDIMVLVDGIPVTDPDGLTRLDLLDPGLVESIEVVRGPGSTMWGVNSTGGVVNILTRSPLGRPHLDVTAETGSHGAIGARLGAAGSLSDAAFYNLHLSRQRADNDWRPHDRFTADHVTLQPAVILGGDVVWQGLVSYTEADLELPGRLVVDPAHGVDQWQPYQGDGRVEETAEPWRHSGRDSTSLSLASRLVVPLGGFELKPQVYWNHWRHRHPVTARINEAETTVAGLDLQLDRQHRRGTLSAGLTARSDRQDTNAFTYRDVEHTPGGRILATLSDRPGEHMESLARDTLLGGVYVQESWRVDEHALLDVGLRLDRIRFRTSGHEWIAYDYGDARYGPGTGAIDNRREYTSVSPRLGLVMGVGPGSSVYASVARGFQTPTSGELTTNPELELTRVTSYEVGWKIRGRRATLDAALFFSPVADEVIQVVEPYGASTYVNAGRTEKTGLELAASFSPRAGLELSGSYAFNHFVYRELSEPVGGENVSRNGNALPFVPRHHYALAASYRHPSGLSARLSFSTWGSYFTDNANSATYRGYRFVTDLALGYETSDLGIGLVVTNLFDRRYAVEVQHDLRGATRYAPAPPRSVLVRLTYRFAAPGGAPP